MPVIGAPEREAVDHAVYFPGKPRRDKVLGGSPLDVVVSGGGADRLALNRSIVP
jgi:hypothetical protein